MKRRIDSNFKKMWRIGPTSVPMLSMLLVVFILVFTSSTLMTHTISGVISDQNNQPLTGVIVQIKGSSEHVVSDHDGFYSITVNDANGILVFQLPGYGKQEVEIKGRKTVNVKMVYGIEILEISDEDTVEFDMMAFEEEQVSAEVFCKVAPMHGKMRMAQAPVSEYKGYMGLNHNTEGYATIHENGFKNPLAAPLSTFSIDVDAASYSNMRRFLKNGQKPPKDAIRLEELINYFDYNYPQPQGDVPFSINYELSECPWNKENKLLHIGLQGKEYESDVLPPSNLVFLIDVSGSMGSANKLPLLKKAFKLLVNQLRDEDRVAIVVYAGSSGLVLPSTSGADKQKIIEALDRLQSGGSTAGAAGLKLAYQVAEENKVDGNNRIILATDGDFNVGQSSNAEMERLIEKYREKDIFISVAGFGMGNYKDDKMEIIADKGNGNYSYIDNLMEAKKVFIDEFGGTLFTIAKDVKIQIEFNPNYVSEYRLVGYENRMLNEEDFDDDKKDAGELGAGHTVTALYEIVPAGREATYQRDLKYQDSEVLAGQNGELATIKLRYKQPEGDKSKLITQTIQNDGKALAASSDNFRFSAAVAGFGMLLRESEFQKDLKYEGILQLAKQAKGEDAFGYRNEFIQLVELGKEL